jgi:Holliday junction resolvasome RuvABC DNA-binding subunit
MNEYLAQDDKAKHCSVNQDTFAFLSTCALLLSYEEDVQWLFTFRKKNEREMFEKLRIPT